MIDEKEKEHCECGCCEHDHEHGHHEHEEHSCCEHDHEHGHHEHEEHSCCEHDHEHGHHEHDEHGCCDHEHEHGHHEHEGNGCCDHEHEHGHHEHEGHGCCDHEHEHGHHEHDEHGCCDHGHDHEHHEHEGHGCCDHEHEHGHHEHGCCDHEHINEVAATKQKNASCVTKTYILSGLNCPNCSVKIEREVGEIEGVTSSVVNLIKQTLTIDVEKEAAASVTKKIEAIVHKHEPDVGVSEKNAPHVTKTYLLSGLNCPNCSVKIEKEVEGLSEVVSSNLNLIKQTLTVEVTTSAAATVGKKIEAIVHKHEPKVGVEEVQSASRPAKENKEKDNSKIMIIRLIVGAIIYGLGIALTYFANASLAVELSFLIVAYVILGCDVVLKAVKNIIRGRIFDENFLMTLSTIGAFVIGEYPEAVAVMLFYQVGEFFQSIAVKRSRKNIVGLMDIRPDVATVNRNGELLIVSPETVAVGEIIVVKPGEKIPLDGVVVSGESMLDTKALTGESVPRNIHAGDEALSGCINISGVLTIKVTKAFGESTVSKIIDLVENASSRKAPTENFITTFARYYTPVVVILAAMLAVIPPLAFGGQWADWIHRGFVFLVISCPCALVISIPLTFFGGIGAASKHGVLVKGSNYLEALNSVDTVVFDKTGTLTKGVFNVTDVVTANGFDGSKVIEYAAKAESFSTHPIAGSILTAYGKDVDKDTIKDYKEKAGHGICAFVDGKKIVAGNNKLMVAEKIEFTPCDKVGTKVYIAVDNTYAGCIVIADEIKADSKTAIAQLKRFGVDNTVMLTGDDEKIAKSVAEELELSEYHAGLLPAQKVEILEQLDSKKRKGKKLAFVGDGINDAPVLARADVGIAMGGLGSDAAIEAADVVLMTDEPSKLVDAIKVSKATKRIVIQNIVFALVVKVAFLVLGAFGIAGMWEAVFGDVGVAIIAILNAMRMMRK